MIHVWPSVSVFCFFLHADLGNCARWIALRFNQLVRCSITSDKQRRGGEINCALRLNSVTGSWEIIEHIPKHLRELRDAIHLDQFKNQKELADHLGTDQSTVSRRMSNAIQLGILSNERIKNSYKLAKEKEVEFDEDDF